MNLMKFNKAKCKVLDLGLENPKHKYSLDEEVIESCPREDLEVLVEQKAQHGPAICARAAQKANHVLGCIKTSMASRSILPPCSALVRPPLEYCIQLWGSKHKKDIDLVEPSQQEEGH
ncbi:hypothetical protein WISP_113954 [Willisornis vidua]|uniref:Uncharacterized protein n=1 Tax=Willisornis vidua TaxID=1566151 RepID=A0ABQ9CUS5_9PASS|nr:hypothetical protein WISP_113954 [Willisornis vidua]